MKQLTSMICLVLGLACHSAFAQSETCARCESTCKGSSAANCVCVKVDGCTCCGASTGNSTSTPAAPAGNARAVPTAKVCVKDTKDVERCGEPTSSVRRAGEHPQ